MNYKEITHTAENERRKAKRININVTIQLKSIDPEHPASSVEVNITDISTTGMAFRSDYPFELGTYYNATIVLDNKETIQTLIEVIRANKNDDSVLYGCRFIGITQEEQFKISVYQIVAENVK